MSLIEKNSSYKHDFTQLARESGFQFRHLHASGTGVAFFDWKEIDNIDVDKIVSDRDFKAIDRLLPHLMEAPIGSLIHNRILDPNIRKYLQLTQLAMQYLLFCKKFLDKTVFGLHSAINDASRDNSKLGRILKRKNQDITALQTKLRDLEDNNGRKNVTRKHFDTEERISPPSTPVAVTDKSLISTIKLELEVKQLKERLNAAEKDLHEQRVTTFNFNNQRNAMKIDSGTQVGEESTKKELQRPKSVTFESQKSPENVISAKRLNEMMREQTKMIEELRESERNSYKKELSDLRTGFKEAFQSLKSSIDSKLADIHHDSVEKVPEKKLPSKIPTKKQPSPSIEDSLTKIGHIDDVIREEHEHWETRFGKLERIFEDNQEMMSNSLQNLSKMYNTKFNTLEKTIKDASLKQLKHEMTQSEPFLAKKVTGNEKLGSNKEIPASPRSTSPVGSPRNLSPAPVRKNLSPSSPKREFFQDPTSVKRSLSPSSPKKEFFQEPVKQNLRPLSPKKQFLQEPTPVKRNISPSPPKKEPEKEKNVGTIKIVRPCNQQLSKGAIPKTAKSPSRSPSPVPDTKFKKNEPKVQQNPTVKITKPSVEMKNVNSPAESQFDLFTAFRNRLKKYGIKHTNKSLSTPQMLAIKSQLVQERIKAKKKHSLFSTIRSRLSTQVSKEAKIRLSQLKDEGFSKEDSSDRFECTKHAMNNIEDIIEESSCSSNSSSESEVIVVTKNKFMLPQLQDVSPKNSPKAKPRMGTLSKTPPLKLSTESIFDISEQAVTSTKLEDQLRRVLDSPIRRPSYPKQHMVKNVVQANAKRVNFSNQMSVSSFHEKPQEKEEKLGKSRKNGSQLSLTNLSDDSDFNFSRFK